MDEVAIHSDSERSLDSFDFETDVLGYALDGFIAIENSRFSTPDRPPTLIDNNVKKRRKMMLSNQNAGVIVDRKESVRQCFICDSRSTILVSGVAICAVCIPLTVGVPLDHRRIKLIVYLRKEVDDLREEIRRCSFTNNSTHFSTLNRRVRDIDRVILDLIQETIL